MNMNMSGDGDFGRGITVCVKSYDLKSEGEKLRVLVNELLLVDSL